MIIRALRAVPGINKIEKKNTDKQINADTCNDPITHCYITHSHYSLIERVFYIHVYIIIIRSR